MKKNLLILFACALLPLIFFKNNAEKAFAAENPSEVVMEISSGRVLSENNSDLARPMASTTKILTAIIVIESDDLSEEIRIPAEAEGVEGSSVYLKAGDIYTVEELLYGLMLRSGNDCSVALAINHSGSVEKFASEMNDKAKSIGAKNSNFVNPNGLPDPNHYTTAEDLALISAYALKNDKFSEIVSTKYYEGRGWKNKNKMLFEYDGADGVKTGYTVAAGRCLVTSAERAGMRLVCVVLGCRQTYEKTRELLDGAFLNYSMCEIYAPEKYAIESDVSDKRIEAVCGKSLVYPLAAEEYERIRLSVLLPEKIFLPVKKGDVAGIVKIYLGNQLIFSENLCIMEDVEKNYDDILKSLTRKFFA